MAGRAGPIMVTFVAQAEINDATKIAAPECKRCFIAVVIRNAKPSRAPTHCSSSRAIVEGSRCVTLKVSWRGTSTYARDHHCGCAFAPLLIALTFGIGPLRPYGAN